MQPKTANVAQTKLMCFYMIIREGVKAIVGASAASYCNLAFENPQIV
jgi:hypothetical protein